ncbi:hypothetical protein GZ22_02330 [Terribacillus saccharophilus]|uniref:Uncharacterized protein n=1 Tax=Terribacillus saccharophilus TaxID=361277 RepID=A0A075LGS5_9BACI|nr:hypothetical protein GZ22_02330 [Terribacillus goriensis]
MALFLNFILLLKWEWLYVSSLARKHKPCPRASLHILLESDAEAKSGKVDGVTGLLWNDNNQQIQFYTTWDCKDGLSEEESAKITDSETAGI